MLAKQLVLFSASNDPIAAAAKNHSGFDVIHVDELESAISCADWPNILDIRFSAEILKRFEGVTLHNRLFSTDGTRVERKLFSWGYEIQWMHVALRTIYHRAKAIVHDPGVRGMSRSLLPLNTQWWLLQSNGVCEVPNYVYSFGTTEPDVRHLKNPMKKSIWSLHDWKEERHFGHSEGHWHPFYVERPTGTPVICNFVGGDVGFVFPKERRDVNLEHFHSLARSVSYSFQSLIGEFLTYVQDDGTVRFYAFSPLLTASATDSDFINRMADLPNRVEAIRPNAARKDLLRDAPQVA